MTSQHSNSLSQPSDEYFAIDKQNFEESLPRLKEFLRKADRHGQLRATKTLLGPCIALCSPTMLGKTLLDEATVVARRLFFESIDEADKLVSSAKFNVIDDVRGRLECCENLMECWLQCLTQLEKFGKLPASQVRGVVENLVEVIKRSFKHCKASEEMYGSLFEKVTQKLTTLFRKTNEVQKFFYTLLERVIVFSKDLESELLALAKVVNSTGEICLLVDGLDMKSVADSWKGFTRIAVSYCNDLKIFSPTCVTPHLTSLADTVSSSLRSTVEDTDHRSAERSIKLYKLLLKILHKLCLSYSGHLGNDAASAVIRLLITLQRYSPTLLKTLNIHLEIIDSIESNFTSGIDQLLNIVLSDTELKEAFFRFETKKTSGDIAYHFLTLLLVNKLITASRESQHMWRKSPFDILQVAFRNTDFFQEEFLVGKPYLGTLPLYDATLTSICGLVVSTSDVDFPSLEILLMENLLSANFWSSLLAADVWCFIDKHASSELSYEHLLYLISVYEILKNRSTCIEAVMLGSLISRLYALSTEETRNRLIDKFETSKACFWSPLRRCISKSDKMFLCELTSTEVKSITGTWETLMKQPSVEIWSSFVNQLTIIGIYGKAKDEATEKTLTEVWNCLKKSFDDFDGIQLHLVIQLTTVLLDATQSYQDDDKSLNSTLATLTSLVPRTVSSVRVKVSYYLRESIENFDRSSPEVTKSLARLYCALLDDGNLWAKQEALESFAELTNASYNEELVMGIVDAVAGVPQICETVSLYLSRTPPSCSKGISSVDAYLRELIKSHRNSVDNHRCPERGESYREEKRRKLVDDQMRPEFPDDLRDRVTKLSNEIDQLLSRRQDLSEASLKKLVIVANKILSNLQK